MPKHIYHTNIASPTHTLLLHAYNHASSAAAAAATAPSLAAMALTSAVANAAAAAAAGAGKKAAQVQLQAELNTDDEWNKFVARDGLLVVDVYTEWCGPCIGMVGNLKKIKVELGGDNLHLAVAKADTIECLKRFRKRSEPTWMFLAGGQLLNVVFGANAPLLARTIEEELRNEQEVRQGKRSRPQRAPSELTPHEQEAAEAARRLAEARAEREAAAAEAARTARREARAKSIDMHFADVCPVLVLPHAQKQLRKITDALELYGLSMADKCPMVVGAEGARALAAEQEELGTEAVAAALADRPALALLVRKNADRDGNVIDLTVEALCGGDEQGMGEPCLRKIPALELRAGDVPALCVPRDRHQRAAVLDLLFPKMVAACVSPAPVALPPRIAMMFGAWQRLAVLAAVREPELAPRLLHFGFFENASVEEPRLLCKTLDQYEQRPDKDYAETIVLAVAVGVAEPALAPAGSGGPQGPPPTLLALGPLHVSEDAVLGAMECDAFFPPGYCQPEPRPRQKTKKKRKKRHEKEGPVESSTEASSEATSTFASGETSGETGGEGGEGGEGGDGDTRDSDDGADDDDDSSEWGGAAVADKATSPPPH